jgi:hypothetical protein
VLVKSALKLRLDLVELGEERGERVARVAGQAVERLFLGGRGGQEQGLDQVADPEPDLGRHVPQRRRGAQSLQSFHCVTVLPASRLRYPP